MAFTLPALPYAHDALEPHIDKQTMEIHHGKHHQAYVTNLNAALEKHPELQSKSADDLLRSINTVPEDIRTAVRNNGGGHVNHTMFWQVMGPKAGGPPTGAIADAINGSFGSYDAFAREGGVDDYSNQWWRAVSEGKAKPEQAINETLASMAAIQYTTGRIVGGPEHRDLLRRIQRYRGVSGGR